MAACSGILPQDGWMVTNATFEREIDMKTIVKWAVALLGMTVLAAGCGDDEQPPSQWSQWQPYEDEENPGILVEGTTWEHYPTFKTDRERQFRYHEISTNRRVDAFVAPADDCRPLAAYESWTDIDKIVVDDYSHELDGESGTPVCVGFEAHLISDDGQWVLEVEMRQR